MNMRLKQLRLERGLTLKEVCAALGVTIGAYNHYEQGIREPPISLICKICDFFDVSADYLLGRVDHY